MEVDWNMARGVGIGRSPNDVAEGNTIHLLGAAFDHVE